MYGDIMYTVPGRVFLEVSKTATAEAHNIIQIATDLFGEENATTVVTQFKKEFPQYSIGPDGQIKNTGLTFGIESVVDDNSLVTFLKRMPNKAHAVAPLIAQYPGAAKKICQLLDSETAVLVQSTGLIYLGQCKPKMKDFAALWESS